MSKHHPDLVMCRRQTGISIGRLCERDDGRCPICDSYVRPTTQVRICDECAFGNYAGTSSQSPSTTFDSRLICEGKCIICGGQGISDAYYCANCTRLEKDRDGCPKIINLGSARTDLFYERRKMGQTGFIPGGGKA
jgi:PHD finger-like domain-containing protein 5A